MLYLRFELSDEARDQLNALRAARDTVESGMLEPSPVFGALRRHAVAASVHYSTRIEGNRLSLAQVESVLRGEQVSAQERHIQEVINYWEAIRYVQQRGAEGPESFSNDTIRTIHYLVSKSLPGFYNPGRYRTDQNSVVDGVSGRVVFRPPPPQVVHMLMDEFLEWLNTTGRQHSVYVRAALTHLNFVAIHPFGDGNGRTGRILEALLFYAEGYMSHELISLEEFFGRDTQSYYSALNSATGPAYRPEDALISDWVNYYINAHYTQATLAVERQEIAVARVEALTTAFSLEQAQALAVYVACSDGAISNSDYRDLADVSNQTAVQHLSRLVELGLLQRVGAGRATRYEPTQRALDVYYSAVPDVTDAAGSDANGDASRSLDQPSLL